MIPGLVLGALGGFAVGRMVSRRFNGGCGMRARGWRGHGFGPWRHLHFLRELDLDRAQRQEVEAVMYKVRRAAADARFAGRGALGTLLETVADESFDRARVEELAARQGDAIGQVKAEIVDGLARIHAVLRPEQRAKLRTLLGGEPARPTEGPYR
jgi:Spy/CpxP family protein refolding chaperone